MGVIGGKTEDDIVYYVCIYAGSRTTPVLWLELLANTCLFGVDYRRGRMPNDSGYWSFALHLGFVRLRVTRSV